jgi:hypothetical protein
MVAYSWNIFAAACKTFDLAWKKQKADSTGESVHQLARHIVSVGHQPDG